MRILVTGGLGFIGHNVVSQLEELGHDVLIIDNFTDYGTIPNEELNHLVTERSSQIYSVCHPYDITEKVRLNNVFKSFQPETVIHLASFPRQKVVNANPILAADSMIKGLLILCELSNTYKVNRFVYISSSMVYGDFTDDVTEDYDCKPQGQYGIMKLAGEWIVKDYSQRNCFNHTIIRPSAVYGPRDVEDRVIAKFMLTAIRGGILTVNGPGETLDFTYVDDAAFGIVTAALSDNTKNKTYNITKSHGRTLLEAAELAVKLAGKGSIEVTDRDFSFPSRGKLNIAAARRDFNFDPKVDIEEGFQRYYEYLQHSPFWAEKTV